MPVNPTGSAVSPNTERHGIIAAGSWTVDRIKLVDVWPQEEHLATIVGTDRQGGGSAHNLGVDIRKLDPGIPVEAIGLAGTDADGMFITEIATQAGIDTTQLHQRNDVESSFTDVITVSSTGRRTFFHNPGSNDLLTPDHFDFSKCNGRILHLGLLGLHATMDSPWQQDANGWVSVLKTAHQVGIKTNLELVSIAADRIRQLALPCIPYLDTLIVNEFELGAVANTNICNQDGTINQQRCIEAAQSLFSFSAHQQGRLQLIVVHSPTTAIAVTCNTDIICRDSFKVDGSDIISSVGAGDAFAAGMLYGIHEGWQIDASLELAHAAAAASLRSPTTVGSVESVQCVLELARGVVA